MQRARLFAQYGVQLADMSHPLGSHLWHDLSRVRCRGSSLQLPAGVATDVLRHVAACVCRRMRLAAPGHNEWTLQAMPAAQGSHALYNEQLVYVAAFAVGARLVFGDRPKQITYSRMLWLPSIGELGRAVLGFLGWGPSTRLLLCWLVGSFAQVCVAFVPAAALVPAAT